MLASVESIVIALCSFSIAILFSIPMVKSFTHAPRVVQNHNTIQQNPIQFSLHELQSQVKVHALLLWTSVGFLMPLGILIIRISNTVQSENSLRILFYFHVFVQVTAVLIAIAGAIYSLLHFENSFDNSHQRIGLAIYVLLCTQTLIACVRPQRGVKRRTLWYFLHWLLGTGVCVLGITDIYLGLNAYRQRTSESIGLWIFLLNVEVVIFVLVYLFQDRWDYMMKQGKGIGDEQVRPTDHSSFSESDKESSTINSKKHKKLQDFIGRL